MKAAWAFLVMCVCAGAVRAQAPATRLDATSQPAGASVVIDGRERGATPVSLFDLRPGRYHVKFRLPGYEDHDTFVAVEEGRPQLAHATLEPEKGLLLVKSEPEGCEISIDGVAVGMTPRLITTLDAKETYRMTLRKAGYREATFEVKFNGRTPLVRHERLILDSGILKIVSTPPGAEVTVNGVRRGPTPVTVTDVPKGRATVSFSLPGYAEETISDIRVLAGDEQVISRVLKGLPGTLSLVSVPEGARLYVNNEFRGKSPLELTGLTPGNYAVRAELEGYGTETRTVTLANGAAAREEFRLSNRMGRLEVRTAPPGVQVFFNGRLAGTTAAAARDAEVSDVLPIENILEGEQVLVLKKDGYAEQTRHPKIESSKTQKMTVRLKRVFIPNVQIVTNNGTYDGVLVDHSPESVTVEVRLGIQRSFSRTEIRKITFLGQKQ
jgi:hypothetical protein